MLKFAPLPSAPRDDQRLAMRVFGLNFPTRSELRRVSTRTPKCRTRCCALGFGFVEVGTITPQPQSGNPRPRVFRLDADRGVINRLGFNSAGRASGCRAAGLRRLPQRGRLAGGIVGINVGANKDSPDRIADYVR